MFFQKLIWVRMYSDVPDVQGPFCLVEMLWAHKPDRVGACPIY